MNEKSVQETQIRVRMPKGKYDYRLIDIGNLRTYQLVFPWKDADNGTLPLLFTVLDRFNLRIISNQRFFVTVSEDAFGTTFVVTF